MLFWAKHECPDQAAAVACQSGGCLPAKTRREHVHVGLGPASLRATVLAGRHPQGLVKVCG